MKKASLKGGVQPKKAAAKTKAKAKAKTKANAQTEDKGQHKRELAELEVATNMSKFELKAFVKTLIKIGGYGPVCGLPGVRGNLKETGLCVASLCTGTNTFGTVVARMLKVLKGPTLKHVLGCDWEKACQTFMLRNGASPHCVFEVFGLHFKKTHMCTYL